MIFHLSAGGVPVTWTIDAAYRSSYGVAHNAARSWFERTLDASRTSQPDSPQFVVELKEVEGTWQVVRKDLFMSPYHLRNQAHDERSWLVQAHSSPFPLGSALETALASALHAALVEFGYLIPKAEWERRYPARVLTAQHYATFSRAYEAYRDSGATAQMPFELRWAPYMESPDGFEFPYDVERIDEDGWRVVAKDGPIEAMPIGTEANTRSRMRLLNAGYSNEQVEIMMRDEPVD